MFRLFRDPRQAPVNADGLSIDRSNKHAPGLVMLYVPGGKGRDFAQKTLADAIQSGAGLSISQRRGVAIVQAGTNAGVPTGWRIGTDLGQTGLMGALDQSTILAVARTNAPLAGSTGSSSDGKIDTDANSIYCERGTSGNEIFKLAVSTTAGSVTQVEFDYRNTSNTLLQLKAVRAGLNDNRAHVYAGTRNGTTMRVMVDGAVTTQNTGAPSTVFTSSILTRSIGYDRDDNVNDWNGAIDLVAGWNRQMSLAELQSISDNPWQLFQRPARRFWMGFTFGTVLGTAADTQGSNQSTATATVAISGTGADTQQLNTSTATINDNEIGNANPVQQPNVSTGAATVSQTVVTGAAAIVQAGNISLGFSTPTSVGMASIIQLVNVSDGESQILVPLDGSAEMEQKPNRSDAEAFFYIQSVDPVIVPVRSHSSRVR